MPINNIKLVFAQFDANVTGAISDFLKSYSIPPDAPIITTGIPIYMKIVIYLTIILIPLSFIKLFFIGKRIYTLFLLFILGTLGLAFVGIFLGFMWLLYQ